MLISLIKAESVPFILSFIEQILEVPIRIELSHVAKLIAKHEVVEEELINMKELSNTLLRVLEEKLGTKEYMNAFAIVQRKVQHIKLQKKQRSKLEAVTNPKVAAQKKVRKDSFLTCLSFCSHSFFLFTDSQESAKEIFSKAQNGQAYVKTRSEKTSYQR